MADALVVTSSFLPGHGGIESFLAEVCDELAPRLAVLAPGRRGDQTLPTDLPYATIPGPGSMLVPNQRVVDAVVEAARDAGTDKVLFGTPWPLILTAPKLRRAGLRYASIVHGSELLVPGAIPVLAHRLARALAEADVLFPVSGFTADKVTALLQRYSLSPPEIQRLYARVDVARFHPGVDTSAVRARLDLKPEGRMLLTFGRLVPRKGVDRAIEALDGIAAAVGPTVLVVAGTGPAEGRLRRLAARTGARVVFAGRVPHAEAPAYYAAADLFVLPVADRWGGLDTEGLGVVLLEAAAAGTPSITGRSGGTPEAVIDGVTGIVIDGSDTQALEEAAIRLLSDDALRGKMGLAGREHVVSRFSNEAPSPLVAWL